MMSFTNKVVKNILATASRNKYRVYLKVMFLLDFKNQLYLTIS